MERSVSISSYEASLARVVPVNARRLALELTKRGKKLWLVGGSVRDVVRAELRREKPRDAGDWDLATDAKPEEVIATFRKVIPTGLKHGTVTVLEGGQSFEVTTLRGERGHSDGRHPDEVFFLEDIALDLARRDFTVNAIAFDLETGTIVDPFDGIGDLGRGVLRAVGAPEARFLEDGLRVLRAARFAATLEMSIEAETLGAIPKTLDSYAKVSFERIRDEYGKALKARAPSRFLRVAKETGLLGASFPELFADSHGENFERACLLIDKTSRDFLLRLTLLFSLGLEGDTKKKVAGALADRLRMSHAERERILLGLDAEILPEDTEGASLRRYLARFGRDSAEIALGFVAARFSEEPTSLGATGTFLTLARRELQSGAAIQMNELHVGGGDLLKAGIPKGPLVGKILGKLFDAVLEDPRENEKQRLVALATKLAEKSDLG